MEEVKKVMKSLSNDGMKNIQYYYIKLTLNYLMKVLMNKEHLQ